MKLPVTDFQRSDTISITAAPPPADSLSRDQSTSARRGCAASPAYSVLTPTKMVGRAAFSTSMNGSTSRGFATSQFSAPTEKYVRKFTVSAKM